jgi:hypothetical protein
MRRTVAVCWVLAWASGLTPSHAAGPTYHKEVVRVLQAHCQDCHRPGQVAPFALLDYEQARKRAGDLAHVTGERRMPPWPASADFGGPFRDQRVLSDPEIATLRDWAAAGAPEGDPADAPPPRAFATDWPLGEPDLVLTMPEPYDLPASGDDEFRVFVLPTKFDSDRWIRAVDFKPGNRKVVHHVIAAVDGSGQGRKKDAADPKPGYVAVGGFGVPTRDFLPIWTPGSKPRFAPDGAGYLLPAGSDILIQLHYHKSGKAEADSTSIGLYLSDAPLKARVQTGFVFPTIPPLQMLALRQKFEAARAEGRRPSLDEMMHDVLVIPAGEADYVIKGSTNSGVMARPLSRDILLTSVMPHMHWLGKSFTFSAVLPDGKSTRVPLIRIDHWDFNWQGTYAFAEPVRLPKGSWFEIEGHYDNSASNPANPTRPPQTVHWGEQTNDEMFLGVYEFIPAADQPAGPAR